jgi:hypothetical protein
LGAAPKARALLHAWLTEHHGRSLRAAHWPLLPLLAATPGVRALKQTGHIEGLF